MEDDNVQPNNVQPNNTKPIKKSKIKILKTVTRQSNNLYKSLCTAADSSNEEKEKELERITKNASIDEPPTSCCGTGCANCVYIVWAEALSSKIQNASPEICQKIIDMVDDPSMKAYLEMELKIRGLKKL